MLEISYQILQILIARIAGHQMRHDSKTKLIIWWWGCTTCTAINTHNQYLQL